MAVLFFMFFPAIFPEESVLLKDDFNRTEQDPQKEQVGNEWLTNSKSRAQGVKQVDLVDNALHITRAKVADHGVSLAHDVAFQNTTIKLRFKLGAEDDLGINLADMKEKSVHAGHICMARIRCHQLELTDLKMGRMKKEIRDARRNGQETDEIKKLLNTKRKRFKLKLAKDEWHQLEMTIEGDKMTVKINDAHVGDFTSPGIGHPSKSRLRIAVNKQAWIDDLVMTGTRP